jgi:hypothetical protein
VSRAFRFTSYLAAAVFAMSTATAVAAPSPKRPVPDYDGRPPAATTTGEVIAYVPRVIFFPLWVVSEFVIRRPLGWVITRAEKGNWPTAIISFFTFGEEKNWGIVPTFYLDLGFRPHVGLYFFADKAFHPAHSVRLRGSGWYDSYTVSFSDRWQVDQRGSRLALDAGATLRPDRLFWGVGPRSLDEDESRFADFRWGVAGSFDLRGGYGEQIRVEVGYRQLSFRSDPCCEGESLDDRIAAGTPAPPGYLEEGYRTFYQRLYASADTRDPRPRDQTGARIAVDLEHGHELEDDGWLRMKGTLGLYWDLRGRNRVLGLAVTTAFAHATRGEVPFTELVDLAGNEVMIGMRSGRLRGDSGIAASVRYEWPIWAVLGGTLQVDVGNVFGEWLEGIEPELMRMSFGFGLRTLTSGDHGLQMLIGFGTETFADGLDVTSLRLAIGGTYGF